MSSGLSSGRIIKATFFRRELEMFEGKLLRIFTCAEKGQQMSSKMTARLLKNAGIEGDRYCLSDAKDGNDSAITLIEVEALEGLQKNYNIELAASQTRRNLLTHNVPLNHLVGKEFRIGKTRFRGIELCEPCASLERRTKKGVLKGLVHRGGLRAAILDDGEITVGDSIYPKS